MSDEILWECVCDLSGKEPRVLRRGAIHFDNNPRDCWWFNTYSSFIEEIGHRMKITRSAYYIFVVDNLPVKMPENFFLELLNTKMYCLIGECRRLRHRDALKNYRKEAGACLIRMQDMLIAHGLPWKTLWDYNLIQISRSTAGRYKRLARR